MSRYDLTEVGPPNVTRPTLTPRAAAYLEAVAARVRDLDEIERYHRARVSALSAALTEADWLAVHQHGGKR